MRIIRNPGWAVVSLNTVSGHIMVREDWKYSFLAAAGARSWTPREEHAFHDAVDNGIWRLWSNRLQVRVSGSDPFARRFRTVRIEFDIHRVSAVGHWAVTVIRDPPGSPRVSSDTQFAARRITFHARDVMDPPRRQTQGDRTHKPEVGRLRTSAGPHEFGHTLPSTSRPGLGTLDEYSTGSPFITDTESIMCVGRQLRPRHLEAVLAELNAMFPGTCTFSA